MLPHNWLSMDLADLAALAPIQEVHIPALAARDIRLSIKREDLLHPLLGGNKLYKLFGYLRDYLQHATTRPIATFGGAYSNHIIATAAAAQMQGVPAIGIIRGERPVTLSATLADAEALGMRLRFVSRSDYKKRAEPSYLARLEEELGPCYWIPEGGAGKLGVEGVRALAEGIYRVAKPLPDAVFHACGTGSSVVGLAAGFAEIGCNIPVYGVAVLKCGTAMSVSVDEQIKALTAKNAQWHLFEQYHGGGYAKLNKEMASFMQGFEDGTGILLDPVYTLKMLWAIVQLAGDGFFPSGSRVLAIHSGGIQGRRGLAASNL